MKNLTLATRLRLALAGAFLLGLLSACASVAPKTQDDILAERVQARWDAVLASDYATAYTYYSPGYRARASATDLEIKLRMQRVKWISARYLDNNCAGEICTVNVDIDYRVSSPVPGVDAWNGFDRAKEQWVRIDGEWWFVPPKDE